MIFEILSTCRGGGYHYVKTRPPHPKANKNGLYPRHRVVVENRIGRVLESDEVVHHIDGNKDNDADENLELLTNAEHSRQHNPEREKVDCKCAFCGAPFKLKPATMRFRLSRGGKVYCSAKCGIASRKKDVAGHGYRYGCRCPQCVADHAARIRKYRDGARRRQESRVGAVASSPGP